MRRPSFPQISLWSKDIWLHCGINNSSTIDIKAVHTVGKVAVGTNGDISIFACAIFDTQCYPYLIVLNLAILNHINADC